MGCTHFETAPRECKAPSPLRSAGALHRATGGMWSAVAERSVDTAFGLQPKNLFYSAVIRKRSLVGERSRLVIPGSAPRECKAPSPLRSAGALCKSLRQVY